MNQYEDIPSGTKPLTNTNYVCEICNIICTSKRTLNYHLETQHSKLKSASCYICGIVLHSKKAKIAHQQIHVWEENLKEERRRRPVYECKICDMQTGSPRALVIHFDDKHPNQNVVTPPKSKTSRKLIENRNEPSRIREKDAECLERTVRCPLCYLSFSESRLKGHLMTGHPSQKSLLCTHCGEIVEGEYEMRCHLMVHTQGAPLHTCNTCQIYFTSTAGLAAHNRLHLGNAPYPCTVCWKEFTTKLGAVAHFYFHVKVETLRDSDITDILSISIPEPIPESVSELVPDFIPVPIQVSDVKPEKVVKESVPESAQVAESVLNESVTGSAQKNESMSESVSLTKLIPIKASVAESVSELVQVTELIPVSEFLLESILEENSVLKLGDSGIEITEILSDDKMYD